MTRNTPAKPLSLGRWDKDDVWLYCYSDTDHVTRWKYSEANYKGGTEPWEKLAMIILRLTAWSVIRKYIFGEGAEQVVCAMREA